MAEELSDLELRERRKRGMELTLADLYAQLRLSGRAEIGWFALYWVVTLLLMFHLRAFSRSDSLASSVIWNNEFPNGALPEEIAIILSCCHLLATLWLSTKLFGRRQHYYSILRAVRRAQNYFHLADDDFMFLSPMERNAAFPKKFGRTSVGKTSVRDIDNTGLWSWYFRRHFWLVGLNFVFIYFVSGCTYSHSPGLPMLLAGIAHFVNMLFWIGLDSEMMANRIEQERDLIGANEDDYPPRETK